MFLLVRSLRLSRWDYLVVSSHHILSWTPLTRTPYFLIAGFVFKPLSICRRRWLLENENQESYSPGEEGDQDFPLSDSKSADNQWLNSYTFVDCIGTTLQTRTFNLILVFSIHAVEMNYWRRRIKVMRLEFKKILNSSKQIPVDSPEILEWNLDGRVGEDTSPGGLLDGRKSSIELP